MNLCLCLALSVAVLVALYKPADSKPNRVVIPKSIDFLSDEYIQYINNLNATWKAGRNFDKSINYDVIRGLVGVQQKKEDLGLNTLVRQIKPSEKIPNNFDARQKWPQCSSIGKIRDQGFCSSGWAFGAVDVMTDRLCIATGGRVNVELSAQDLMTCCPKCSSKGNGCEGGDPNAAWQYYVSDGLVSGGDYGTHGTCQSYQVQPCPIIHIRDQILRACFDKTPPRACSKKCDKSYNRTYAEDKYYGQTAYKIPNDVKQIQYEILNHGPVEAVVRVYIDLFQYKSGVFEHYSEKDLGLQAVRIVGWGETKHYVPYWLVANSWNTGWGENGYFKILRGSDECGIESSVIAGLPKV